MAKSLPAVKMTIKPGLTFSPKTITIHWARHAESCSNFKGANYRDENLYPNREEGYEKLTDVERKHLKEQTSNIKRHVTNVTSKISPKLLRNIAMYHPNLSFIGMQQAILLGTNFVRNQLPYDAVFVSPSLRTIMTALLAFRGTNQRIIVVPFIVEHLNIAGKFDNVNPPLDLDKLKKYVAFVKDWLTKNWINNFDDIEIMTLLNTINDSIKRIGLLDISSKTHSAWLQGWDNFNCWEKMEACSSKPGSKDCQKHKHLKCTSINDCIKQNKKSCLDDSNCRYHTGMNCNPNKEIKGSDFVAVLHLIYTIALINYDGLHKLSHHDLPPVKQLLKEIVDLMPAVLSAVTRDKDAYINSHQTNPKEGIEIVREVKITLNILEKNINEAYQRLKKIVEDPLDVRGPSVDFSWVENFRGKPEFTEINMGKFYTEILCRYLVRPDVIDKSELKIMCVSHGAAMREYFGEKYPREKKPKADLRNTQVYEEIFTVSRADKTIGAKNMICKFVFNEINYEKYVPPLIRTSYQNFEVANIDVCQLRGLKGVLHYAIADPKNERKIISLKTNVSDMLHRKGSTNLADYVTKDLRFYFEDPMHAEKYSRKPCEMVIKGGYYDKYVKYKYKYLQLKQQINNSKKFNY